MKPGTGKDELEVLLSEVEIGPYKIKPWSFGQFKKVYPVLIGIIPALKAMDINPDNVQDVLTDRGLEVVGAALPVFAGLIAATLDIPEEKVDGMDFDQAAAIGITILSQNIDRLKNSLPLIMDQIKTLIRAA